MAFFDTRTFRILFAFAVAVGVFAVCVTGWWVSTYMLPVRDVKATVQKKLPDAEAATFEHVTFNKATRVGCGYVTVKKRADGSLERSQFILFPDGRLLLPPPELKEGDASQQIAALEAQGDYAKLVVQNCLR